MNQINYSSKSKTVSTKNISNPMLLLFEMRPKQWTKNFLIFAAPLFAFRIMKVDDWFKVCWGFILFCMLSGIVYIMNDFVDLEKDRQHPDKKDRPMASGDLNPTLAVSFGAVLLVFAFMCSLRIGVLFTAIATIYFFINVLYSLFLKHIVVVDVLLIAAGFVLRAMAGAILINGPITPWFLLCIMWLALFLAISKRRNEICVLQSKKGSHRKVLDFYNEGFLDQMNSIVTTATIISYSLFTSTSGHSLYLMFTIPLVIYGIFRYLYLVHGEGKGGKPEEVLLEDKHILFTVLLFVIVVAVVIGIIDKPHI